MDASAIGTASSSGPIFPYLQAGPWSVGPITLHAFGLLVFLGILMGFWAFRRRASRVRLDTNHLYSLLLWGFGAGLALSHAFYFGLYHPDKPIGGILHLVNVFDGMSSFGGFLGVLLGIAAYSYIHRLPFLLYVDTVMWGSAHGWVIARLGCAFAHDHPGTFTGSWFAVRWPANHPDQIFNTAQFAGRHDLGLYEMFVTAGILIALYATNRKGLRLPGFNLALCLVLYSPARFFMDSLRALDARYLGWTPGQYAAVVFGLTGLIFFLYHFAYGPLKRRRIQT